MKLALTPFLNDWWNVAFRVTARGLTSSLIPAGRRVFQVDFDLLAKKTEGFSGADLMAVLDAAVEAKLREAL